MLKTVKTRAPERGGGKVVGSCLINKGDLNYFPLLEYEGCQNFGALVSALRPRPNLIFNMNC